MSVTLRPPRPQDADAVAQLVFNAFCGIQDRHGFARDFPTVEFAQGMMVDWMNHPAVWGVVAESGDGRLVGCNFVEERGEVRGVGPICIDPDAQGGGVGRTLMRAALERGKGAPSVRLVQEAFNTTSMSLYASVGFDVKEPLAIMVGVPSGAAGAGKRVRPMTEADVEPCAALYRDVHGFDRSAELRDAIAHFKPFVLERNGRIVAYTSAPNVYLMNHGVARTPQDMQDLLLGAAAHTAAPIGVLVPTRNADFFRWCLTQRLRMLKPATLMSTGTYHEPRGWWFPSILY